MKKYFFFFLLFSNVILAQDITEEEIIGTWKVTEIEGLNKIPNKEAKMMATLFLDATFKFQEDFRFDLILKNKNGLFEKELLKEMTNAKWIYNPEKSLISIGQKSNNYKIMGIYVSEKETQIYFLLSETSIILKVLKEGWN